MRGQGRGGPTPLLLVGEESEEDEAGEEAREDQVGRREFVPG